MMQYKWAIQKDFKGGFRKCQHFHIFKNDEKPKYLKAFDLHRTGVLMPKVDISHKNENKRHFCILKAR